MRKDGIKKIAIMSDMMDRPARGTALYARKLVENLLPLQKEFGFELYLVHSKKNDDVLYQKANEIMLPKITIPKLGKILSEAYFLFANRKHYDIIHYPQESIYPLFWLSKAKIVLTVLSHIEGWRDYGLPIRYRLVDITLRYFGWRISAIICGSASTVGESILRFFPIPRNKIYHTALGIDPAFFDAPAKEEAMKRISMKYKLPVPFILAPGRLDLQKNIPRVVEAYAHLKNESECPALVIGAKHRSDEDARVAALIEQHHLSSSVHYLPYIEDVDMPALYAAATMTVFPSLHEGFGLPILESMAAGTAVITSNIFSMPEVASDAALLVTPTDAGEIQAAMKQLLSDNILRASLETKGRARAHSFSWEKMGRETAEVYGSLFGETH